MQETKNPFCPDCEQDRRRFMVAGVAGILAASALGNSAVRADEPKAGSAKRDPKPAEALIQELYGSMTAEQKKTMVFPWNDQRRRGMYNAAFGPRIGEAYTPVQKELIERILRSISSGEDGYSKLTRNGTFDGSGSLGGCGAYIFGDPSNTENRQFAWVFAGHHITVRCDGNSEPNAAFGGPMYYGHSPDGYSEDNCFNYQTRSVQSVFEALGEAQRRKAVLTGSPGEHAQSIRFRASGQPHPGIAAKELSADQRGLVETVMRTILDPYRREDAQEVMDIVRKNGGLERIHLAFYRDREATDNKRWHFWRLEGPGFVWNFRVLPHVHTYVNIAAV